MELSAILAGLGYLASGILAIVIALLVADDISARAVIAFVCFWGFMFLFGYLLTRFEHRLNKRF